MSRPPTGLHLAAGGSARSVDGSPAVQEPRAEYEGIYRRFATLLSAGTGEVDPAPFQLVADAFLIGKRVETDVFEP